MVQQFDRVIAVSNQIKNELESAGARAGTLRLLHNAIVVERYQRTGRTGYLAELTGRQLCRPVIVSIGRISPEKGQMDLVEALGIVRAQGGKVSAILVGDGPDRARVWERVCELGLQDSVSLTGYLSNPERVLEEADLMVLPSHTEGLPNVVLEALAMQVPVLATSVGGTPEIVTEGETGRLVPPRSPEALAAAIRAFLTDPRPYKRMAEQGRTLVQEQFDFKTRTRRLESIYAELVSQSPS